MKNEQKARQNLETMLTRHGIPNGSRITQKTIRRMVEERAARYSAATDYADLVNELDAIGNRVLIVGQQWAVPMDENNLMRKDLSEEAYAMLGRKAQVLPRIDNLRSQQWKVCRGDPEIIANYRRNGELSERLVQLCNIMPEDFFHHTSGDVNDPKIGFAYRNLNRHFVSTTWAALTKGYAIYRAAKKEEGVVEVLQKKPYAGAFQTGVVNGDGERHIVELNSVPITLSTHPQRREIRAWNMEAHCSCKDHSFVGVQHRKQANPMVRGCKHVVAAYMTGKDEFDGMQDEYKGKPVELEWHGNVFPKLNTSGLALARKLEAKIVLKPEEGPVRTLNDTEFSQVFGAYIARDGLDAYIRR